MKPAPKKEEATNGALSRQRRGRKKTQFEKPEVP